MDLYYYIYAISDLEDDWVGSLFTNILDISNNWFSTDQMGEQVSWILWQIVPGDGGWYDMLINYRNPSSSTHLHGQDSGMAFAQATDENADHDVRYGESGRGIGGRTGGRGRYGGRTLIGSGTLISMLLSIWYKTLISLTKSETATYSASVVDNTTLFMLLLFHATGTPQK